MSSTSTPARSHQEATEADALLAPDTSEDAGLNKVAHRLEAQAQASNTPPVPRVDAAVTSGHGSNADSSTFREAAHATMSLDAPPMDTQLSQPQPTVLQYHGLPLLAEEADMDQVATAETEHSPLINVIEPTVAPVAIGERSYTATSTTSDVDADSLHAAQYRRHVARSSVDSEKLRTAIVASFAERGVTEHDVDDSIEDDGSKGVLAIAHASN
ncbi:hypothetical protein THASP1DRAFT_33171, partial [Thamnocephalis sphaerospora]